MIKPQIRNLVSTSDLKQKVDISQFPHFPWGIYDVAIYGGICGYFKTPEISGKVTIFNSGKMISMGTKSILDSFKQLETAKFYLLRDKFISKDVKLDKKVRNIVVTLTLNNKLNLKKISSKLDGCTFQPNLFPAVIWKTPNGTFLLFSTGKIVINGIKSEKSMRLASRDIQIKLIPLT